MRSIVVAYGANRGIGYGGQLPWRLPSDMRRFRELTIGGTVLMGRKTYESLPDTFRPLPQRRNIVVSANPAFEAVGAEVCHSVNAALQACGEDCFVIGGGTIYEQTLAACKRVYATIVHASPLSDTYFPELPAAEWHLSERAGDIWENGTRFHFATYDRIR
ncbi:MAG TPA: dihydrofolate reductase [Solirubrobacteraceae bacterium]|jgi:dihydrofolate reductase|nr:dihydrofolate reductase [Solirubrobacteraceae bacterium]